MKAEYASLTATLCYPVDGQEASFINNNPLTSGGTRYYRLIHQFQQGA